MVKPTGLCVNRLVVVQSTYEYAYELVRVVLAVTAAFIVHKPFWLRCTLQKCDEMAGDRPKQLANKNCFRLSRVLWAKAKIT